MTFAEAEETVRAANQGLGRVSEESGLQGQAQVYGKKVKKERPTGMSLFTIQIGGRS
jgi:hypothetical protein